MYIVSRCLLGHNCKYNGGNNKNDEVIEFCKTHDCVTICPETAGGLKAPRAPSEIVRDGSGNIRVVSSEGNDVTDCFIEGAARSVTYIKDELAARGVHSRIEGAILKANSPSCGSGMIYDGTFTGTKTEGSGIFTDMLLKEFRGSYDFPVTDETGISKLVDK